MSLLYSSVEVAVLTARGAFALTFAVFVVRLGVRFVMVVLIVLFFLALCH